jgi:hypothetical protein
MLKAHVGADADTALVGAVSVMPATAHDGCEAPAVLPDGQETRARLGARNAPIQCIRAQVFLERKPC